MCVQQLLPDLKSSKTELQKLEAIFASTDNARAMASAYSLTLSASLCMSTASHATAGSIRSDTASVKSVSLHSASENEDPEVMTLIRDHPCPHFITFHRKNSRIPDTMQNF